jgi:hypothetical protein
MLKAYPEEFRNDVVALARKREIPWTQIAKDWHETTAVPCQRIWQPPAGRCHVPGTFAIYLCRPIWHRRQAGLDVNQSG